MAKEYQIKFTSDDIRYAAGGYRRDREPWGWYPADLTEEQCDAIADAITDMFETDFLENVRNVEV